jgi:drug/metabolite transporter (DMT)-like permease
MSYRWKRLFAFGMIYFVWGSTYLAIRVGVHAVPPLLFAAMRFFTAGLVLVVWAMSARQPWPTARQWASISFLGTLIFLGDYGLLFWAELKVPSGVAAIIMATIPVFIALADITILRAHRMTLRLGGGLLIGLGGVAVLMSHSLGWLGLWGGEAVSAVGAVALIVASIFWAVGTVLTRKLPLPESKVLTAGGEMLVGGVMLAVVSTALGEPRGFHAAAVSGEAWFALVYLILVGSIAGFTSFLWLIARESPTKVATYAYVNPIVAVLLGHFAAGEPLSLRTVLGMALVLISVLLITLRKTSGRGEQRLVTAAKGVA